MDACQGLGAPAGVRALVGLFCRWGRFGGGEVAFARERFVKGKAEMLKSETLKSICCRGRDGGGLQFLEGEFGGEFFHDGEAEVGLDGGRVRDVAIGFVDADELGAGTELFFGGHGGG